MLTTATLSALVAAATPLAPEAAAAATQVAAEAVPGGINYLTLVLKASVPVQLVMLLLLAGSVYS
ncbi:MAG: protein TolQ, partial [Lysobacteraceae bacterium]